MTGLLVTSSCDEKLGSPGNELSEEQIVNGLKTALKTGTDRAVDTLNQPDGYFRDQAVKIVFPPKASEVANKLRDIGAGSLVDNIVKKMNRAAEKAADTAAPIFINAVTNMQFQDARNILEGRDTAATNFFRNNTRSQLFSAFKPFRLLAAMCRQTWLPMPPIRPWRACLLSSKKRKNASGRIRRPAPRISWKRFLVRWITKQRPRRT
jgi:hypothetical protein